MFNFSFNLKDRPAWLSPAKAEPVRPKPIHPVVLVPGYRDNSRVFHQLIRHLKKQHFDVHALSLQPSDGRIPLNQLAEQVDAYVETTFAPEQVLDFVGFSMGGIVLRYYLQRLGGLARADHFITLGSPHRGTWMAYSSRRPGVLQMRPRSPFLLDLAQDEEKLAQIRFISIWTPLDLTIVPSSSSVTSVGQHQRLMLPYHRALVTDGRSLQVVANALLEPVSAGFDPSHLS
jgi:triacylglycerol lipase